ncbi:hypothetical protein DHEL01_v211087 [Diaporthe helianthi]|uniref:Uncharacterized protein n=1 Tax=Diaporthe helianthi TaxID=158607 RepID=A0A2P5HJU4_DIAHE|nr:hypothetical protein DHEL01_v211087 [Diaporthe helianthi]
MLPSARITGHDASIVVTGLIRNLGFISVCLWESFDGPGAASCPHNGDKKARTRTVVTEMETKEVAEGEGAVGKMAMAVEVMANETAVVGSEAKMVMEVKAEVGRDPVARMDKALQMVLHRAADEGDQFPIMMVVEDKAKVGHHLPRVARVQIPVDREIRTTDHRKEARQEANKAVVTGTKGKEKTRIIRTGTRTAVRIRAIEARAKVRTIRARTKMAIEIKSKSEESTSTTQEQTSTSTPEAQPTEQPQPPPPSSETTPLAAQTQPSLSPPPPPRPPRPPPPPEQTPPSETSSTLTTSSSTSSLPTSSSTSTTQQQQSPAASSSPSPSSPPLAAQTQVPFSTQTTPPPVPLPIVVPTPAAGASSVAELSPSSSLASVPIQSAVAANNGTSSSPGPVMSSGKMAGIAVGSVSAVALIGTLILILFRLRRRGYLRSFKSPLKSSRNSMGRAKRISSRTSTPEPEMSETRMPAGGPSADRLSRARSPSAWYYDDGDTSAYPPVLDRPLPVKQNSSKGVVGRGGTPRKTLDRDSDGFFVGSTLSPVPEARSVMSQTTGAALVVPPSPVLQTNKSREPLAQQAEPAASFNCPVQKLQNKLLRLHNSTDPRPCTKHCSHPQADRGSVSSVSSCTTCGGSSPRESRSYFAFLLQPPLDLFKSKRSSSDNGSRKSGWSL